MKNRERASERASKHSARFCTTPPAVLSFPFSHHLPFNPLFFSFKTLSLSLFLSFSLSLSLIQDMDKLAVGPLVNPHRVSLSYPVAQNLASIAEALSKPVSEVTVEKI